MTDTLECSRCGKVNPALGSPPIPGPVGGEIQSKICADCWQEWQSMEVMVINELRLNFMDPEAQNVLQQHMREFLQLEKPSGES